MNTQHISLAFFMLAPSAFRRFCLDTLAPPLHISRLTGITAVFHYRCSNLCRGNLNALRPAQQAFSQSEL